jgi:hypothetical protein
MMEQQQQQLQQQLKHRCRTIRHSSSSSSFTHNDRRSIVVGQQQQQQQQQFRHPQRIINTTTTMNATKRIICHSNYYNCRKIIPLLVLVLVLLSFLIPSTNASYTITLKGPGDMECFLVRVPKEHASTIRYVQKNVTLRSS